MNKDTLHTRDMQTIILYIISKKNYIMTSKILKEIESSQRLSKDYDNTMRVECYIGATLNYKEIRSWQVSTSHAMRHNDLAITHFS